jgi:tetratricopeptide (TPR) repeat protein
VFRRCVSDDPDEPLGHRALGVALSRTGDFDGSVNALSRSLELDDAPYVRRALARTFIDRGLASAENVLREGLSLQPSHRERFEALAENLHTQGRAAEAAELEDRASELPTKDERIRSRRAKRDALDP